MYVFVWPHSTLGGFQPQTQQLSHVDAPISGVPGPGRVPHLQVQEVGNFVIYFPRR